MKAKQINKWPNSLAKPSILSADGGNALLSKSFKALKRNCPEEKTTVVKILRSK